jgi:hypothetical protein
MLYMLFKRSWNLDTMAAITFKALQFIRRKKKNVQTLHKSNWFRNVLPPSETQVKDSTLFSK